MAEERDEAGGEVNFVFMSDPMSFQVYMLDTNVFNRVLDGTLFIPKHGNFSLQATRIQMSELNATKDAKRRQDLSTVFERILLPSN
jgi:hypothetical protein